ncbi:MAG: hypothetical protein KGJ62_04990 [Armatimonadetes bacterium]|nr:hypothetical protein [Armatimonadota bacterium]MDE2205417.1 hypothetical protein [Armatimonadota bacterium]
MLITTAALLLSLTNASSAAPPNPWPPRRFSISAWCAPPVAYTNLTTYQAMEHAGLTLVMPPLGQAPTVTENLHILDLCRACHMQAIIADARMPAGMSSAGATAAVASIAKDYAHQPALLGYFLADEPGADAFANEGSVIAAFRRADPSHIVYVNLFPNYATTNLQRPQSQLQTNTYHGYVTKFAAEARPWLISWDYYTLLISHDRNGFFSNLAECRTDAAAAGLPFWQIVLSTQILSYRSPTLAELRFQALQTLAYGAHGLLWFTWWPPDSQGLKSSHDVVDATGKPAALFGDISTVDAETSEIARWLYTALSLQVYQTGDIPAGGNPQPPDAMAFTTSKTNWTIGVFRGGDGFVYVLAANRDYTAPATMDLSLESNGDPVQMLDLHNDRWVSAAGKPDDNNNMVVPITAGPGDAVLLRWQ